MIMLWTNNVTCVIQTILLYIAIIDICLTTTVSFSYYSGYISTRRVSFFMVKPTTLDINNNSSKRMTSFSKTTIDSALNFVQLTLQLKQTLRTGWVLRGIPHAESVADHSWHVALMCLFLLKPDSKIDIVKCAQVRCILSELIIGSLMFITHHSFLSYTVFNIIDGIDT